MAKVRQTVSGSFRSAKHAQAHCRISSCLQSIALQGYRPIAAIQIALNGNTADMVEAPAKERPQSGAGGE